MEGGKISVQFPQYHFTAELVDDKLVMVRETTPDLSPRQSVSKLLVVTTIKFAACCIFVPKNIFLFSIPCPSELCNSRREGSDFQKN